MAKADTITMRVDPELKYKAEILCDSMGLTLSTAYTMFLKAIVRTRSIPFPIVAEDPFWSEENQEHLMAAIGRLKAGKGEEHELIDA